MHRPSLLFALLATPIIPTQFARAEPPPAPLAGPRVVAKAPGIIERGFDGLVKPAEPTPEEAALGLLTLTEEESAATRTVLITRSRILDDFIANNISMLTQFGVAAGTGDKKEQFALAYNAFLKLKPLADLGPLQDQLHASLRPENAVRFTAILKEYWNEYVKDRRHIKKPDGKYPNRFEIMVAAKFENLGREGERAFQQMMYGGDLIYQYLFKGISLRPEQAGKLREIVSDFSARTKGEPTNEQNAQLFFRIIPVLDLEQKKQFAANLRELAGQPPKKPKPAAKKD